MIHFYTLNNNVDINVSKNEWQIIVSEEIRERKKHANNKINLFIAV